MAIITRIIASITQYISEAVIRIFGPSDDAYPLVGVQPFTGDVYKEGAAGSW
ncbi:MAG: nicotinate phosphoribosyltransferase [Cyanomargarita calcarea GSE-NOS-MK-12-04C]|jgi:hypothetical protein|uniref:Nicotinate phosphoribosyltransferase n=1 Tax=Cyanomargarita calcarea GSE-NOS-MK-12-04C TaxID=2839659 RepID=A0A951QYE1_9CYAN|nr:nicotinate phosphoribosyltransferase [Cyanomargarita calcarea GSE-NOS-MK-12-04C]